LGPKTQNSQNSQNSQNYQNPQNPQNSQNQHTTPSTPQSSSAPHLPVGDKDESNQLSPFPESLTSRISSIDENTSAKPENASSTNSNDTNSDPAASSSNTNKFTNKYAGMGAIKNAFSSQIPYGFQQSETLYTIPDYAKKATQFKNEYFKKLNPKYREIFLKCRTLG